MRVRGASTESFVPAARVQGAALSRPKKQLALASAQGILGSPAAAKQMRRLCGPGCGAVRQDVLAEADMDVSPEGDAGFEEWVAHRKAKKKGWGKKKEEGDSGKNRFGGMARLSMALTCAREFVIVVTPAPASTAQHRNAHRLMSPEVSRHLILHPCAKSLDLLFLPHQRNHWSAPRLMSRP